MKAIQLHSYGGVDQLRLEDVPVPKAGPDEVLVKVAATSVNPIDWKIRRGDLKSVMPVQFPIILGRDLAGEVVEAGVNAKWKRGQRVMGLVNRTYAEFVSAPAEVLAAVPEGLDVVQAAVLPLVTTTGAELIDHLALQPGQTVLVTGATGNVGRSAVYIAKERGAHVIAGVRGKHKREAEALGAHAVLAIDNDAEIAALPELDAIADTVNGEVIGKLLGKLRRGGTLGSVVGKPKAAEGRDIRVQAFVAQPDAGILRRLAEAVRDGQLSIPIAKKYKLADAAEAQRDSEEGRVDGKVALVA